MNPVGQGEETRGRTGFFHLTDHTAEDFRADALTDMFRDNGKGTDFVQRIAVIPYGDTADEFAVEFSDPEIGDFLMNILFCAGEEQTLFRIAAEKGPYVVHVGVVGVTESLFRIVPCRSYDQSTVEHDLISPARTWRIRVPRKI